MAWAAIWLVLAASVTTLSGFALAAAGPAAAQSMLPISSGFFTNIDNQQVTSTNADSDLQQRGGKGARASTTKTGGSTSIFTTPKPTAGSDAGVYGPFFND